MQSCAPRTQSSGMMFHETELREVFEIHLESKPVERGFFADIWSQSGPQSVVADATAVRSPRREVLYEDNIQRP